MERNQVSSRSSRPHHEIMLLIEDVATAQEKQYNEIFREVIFEITNVTKHLRKYLKLLARENSNEKE